MSKNYTEDSIQTLDILTAIRQKMNMYTGHRSNDSIQHLVKEVVGNSLDELLAGYGTEIIIELNTETNTLAVADFGRGIPFGSIVEIFSEIHSSGKFEKEEDSVYKASIGTHGVANIIVRALSKEVKVNSFRNGQEAEFIFKQEDIVEKPIKKTNRKDGTIITIIPDSTLDIDDVLFYPHKIENYLQIISYAIPECKFVFIVDGKEKIYQSTGVKQFLSDTINKEDMLSNIHSFKISQNGYIVEGALVWAMSPPEELTFINLLPVYSGNHIRIIRAAITRSINKVMNSGLKGDNIRKHLSYVFSIKIPEDIVFSSQEKAVLSMPSINTPLSQMLSPEFEKIAQMNKKMFENMIKEEEKERKKELANLQAKVIMSKANSKKTLTKLRPALSEKGAELFIAEGNSAAGSLIAQRDPVKHAIMPLKGKIINFRKHDLEKVLQNEEIEDLIITLRGFGDSFRMSALPYDKIVLATDADE